MSNESLDRFAQSKLDRLTANGLCRSVVDTQRTDAVNIRRGSRDLVSFCCNDYLGLTHHPAVKAAAAGAVAEHGAGAGASRLITGNHPLYAVLEQKLAALKGTEAACVFGSGYMANAGILPALAGPDDLIVIDELGHASMYMGARAARSELAFRPTTPAIFRTSSHAKNICCASSSLKACSAWMGTALHSTTWRRCVLVMTRG